MGEASKSKHAPGALHGSRGRGGRPRRPPDTPKTCALRHGRWRRRVLPRTSFQRWPPDGQTKTTSPRASFAPPNKIPAGARGARTHDETQRGGAGCGRPPPAAPKQTRNHSSHLRHRLLLGAKGRRHPGRAPESSRRARPPPLFQHSHKPDASETKHNADSRACFWLFRRHERTSGNRRGAATSLLTRQDMGHDISISDGQALWLARSPQAAKISYSYLPGGQVNTHTHTRGDTCQLRPFSPRLLRATPLAEEAWPCHIAAGACSAASNSQNDPHISVSYKAPLQ